MGREPERNTTDAADFRKRILEREPRGLREWALRQVVEGVEEGLIMVGDLGFAEARNPHSPRFRDVPPTAGDRNAEFSRRLEAYQRELSTSGRLGAEVELNQRVEDLNFLLRLAEVQEAALEALGERLDDVPAQDSMVASGIARDIAAVSYGRSPPEALERIQWVIDAAVRKHTGKPAWLQGAETSLRCVLTSGESLGLKRAARTRRLDGIRAVEWFLEMLSHTAGERPRALQAPTQAARREAARFLSNLHVSDLKPEFQPKRGRGRAPSVATAAEKLVNLLGARAQGRARDRRRRQKN